MRMTYRSTAFQGHKGKKDGLVQLSFLVGLLCEFVVLAVCQSLKFL